MSASDTMAEGKQRAMHGAGDAPPSNRERVALATYINGFILSIVLTVTAYDVVVSHSFGHTVLLQIIIGLALAQCLVQLVFFLHLGRDTRPRWKLLVFLFMLLVVAILVFGSLWIMSNLNVRMTPQQINTYLNGQQQDGL